MVVEPRLRNIHTWFARRPTSPARALTLASILPADTTIDINTIKDMIGFENLRIIAKRYGATLITYASPDKMLIRELVKKYLGKDPRDIVVDPMSCGGSIPLRLGFRTVAIEYNPVAYLILKATVEFPAKYADPGLFEKTFNVAREFIIKARDELSRYFGEDAENYIFARGVRCPFCGGLIHVSTIQLSKRQSYRKRFIQVEFDKEKKTFTIDTIDTKLTNLLKKEVTMSSVLTAINGFNSEDGLRLEERPLIAHLSPYGMITMKRGGLFKRSET